MPLSDHDDDPLDRQRLEFLRQLGPADGWGLLPAVVNAFLDDLPVRRAALRDAVRNGGGQPLAEAAHQLKGSAANIGASAVAELCQQLEASDHGAGEATAPELLDRLETELDRAEHALSASLPAS
jgi:HPt (histidine-containing phosphotransfer) domain-containing protein